MATTVGDKDFLKEIASQAKALRQEIEAYQQGIDPSAAAILARQRQVLVEKDFKFFAYTYFPHHIRGEPSSFQKHFCQHFPKLLTQSNGCCEWWIAPRGEAKTTLLTKIGCVWIAIQALTQSVALRKKLNLKTDQSAIDYVVLLGAETSFPEKLIEVVKTELEFNTALRVDFPEACGMGTLWRIGEIVTNSGVKFESFGAEQAIRGTFFGASRPQVILGDDLITDKEAKSPTERENRWLWYNRAVSYLGPPDGSVKALNVATVLNTDDPVSRAKKSTTHVVHHFKAIEQLPERMDLWEECEMIMRNHDQIAIKTLASQGLSYELEKLPSYQFYLENKREMDKGAVISWESVRSLFQLMRARADNPKAFSTEMQGEARDDADRVFTRWNFWVSRLSHWRMFGACDPSLGKGETADPSSLVIGGYDITNNTLNVIEAQIKRRVSSKLEADLISFQKEYQCLAWAFENNNAYEYMRQSFMQNALKQGVSLPLIGVTATVPLEVRVDSLEPYICSLSPRILFHSKLNHLLEELDTYPHAQPHHHYDGLVALHLLWMISTTRSAGAPTITTARRSRQSFAGYDNGF